MKNQYFFVTLLVLLLVSSTLVTQNVTPPNPAPDNPPPRKAEADKLKAAADASSPERCTESCLDAARVLAELSNDYFTLGNVDEGHAAMKEAGRLAEKAGDASVSSKKRRKQTEITLRKLEKRISDIEQTLNFEDRPAVHEIVARLDKTRSDILMSMFDMPKKELGPEKEKQR